MPQVGVVLYKESMIQRSVVKSYVKRKTILNLVGHVARSVEVERSQVTRDIHSDVDGLGQGNTDVVDGGCVFLICANANVPALHLFSAVNGDVAEEPALVRCAWSAD